RGLSLLDAYQDRHCWNAIQPRHTFFYRLLRRRCRESNVPRPAGVLRRKYPRSFVTDRALSYRPNDRESAPRNLYYPRTPIPDLVQADKMRFQRAASARWQTPPSEPPFRLCPRRERL